VIEAKSIKLNFGGTAIFVLFKTPVEGERLRWEERI